jgi:hypothetical protein
LEIAYGAGVSTRKTRKEEASRLAAKPEVKAAIVEYEERLMPIGDLRACQERMLANLQSLALESPDERVRLQAATTLYGICGERLERLERVRSSGRTVTIDALVNEIAELASAPAPDGLELESLDKTADGGRGEVPGVDADQ